MTKKLDAMPYAQAHITNNNGIITLVSYVTPVVEVDTTTGWARCTGTYSQTTRKHISAFCKEIGYGLSYSLMKMLVANNEKYNIYTGEVVGLA